MRALVTLALALCLSGCGAAASESPTPPSTPSAGHVERVSGRQARALVAAGATLLDVRSGFEFAIGHIDGASNIPVDELARRTGELDPDAPVVVYCLSGHRSADAARTLEAAGFTHVYDVGSMLSY